MVPPCTGQMGIGGAGRDLLPHNDGLKTRAKMAKRGEELFCDCFQLFGLRRNGIGETTRVVDPTRLTECRMPAPETRLYRAVAGQPQRQSDRFPAFGRSLH